MYNFDMILNIIMTALLGYVTVNTIFRYHFSLDQIAFLFTLFLFATMIGYRGTEKIFEFGLTVGIEIVAFGIAWYVAYRKHRLGYFLFNVYWQDYEKLHREILDLSREAGIEKPQLVHPKSRPFLLIFRDVDPKIVRPLVKKLDTNHTHIKKTFTMYNYWFIVAFIVLEVIIWRF